MKKYRVVVRDINDVVICSKFVKSTDEHKAVSEVLKYCIDVLGFDKYSFYEICCDWSHKSWF